MIGEQGIIYLAEALKRNKTLAVLSLEANYIGEYGAEALAESLKVNTSLTDVNLKENDLCDDGVRAIAEALAVNRSINCLDLSNNSIGSRGTTFLAETLRNNTSLHYLILTGNLLYDEGAEALAEALRDNQSLQALELANNAIREVGVMAVASILSHNTALSDLDVSLNEAGLRGEITLYDAMMGQPGREIVWKAPGAECIWTSEEVQQIIEHYGVTRILKGLIIDDQGLDPLIPDEKLISHLTFPTVALANSFFTDIFFATDDRDFTKHISMKVRAISALIGMLKSFQITTTEEANLPLDKQNPLIQAVCNHFEELASMLSCPKELQGKKVMLPAGPVSPPVSSFRLKLLDLFKVLVNTHCACIDARIVRYRIIKTCLNLFFRYQWNPFLQQGVIDFIIAVLESNRDVLTNETTTGCQLFTRIVEAFKQESGKPQTKRAGYMAHLTQLANLLNDVTQRNPALNRAAKGDKAWQAFLASELATANKNNGTWDSMFPRPPPGQRPSFPTKPIDPSSEFGVS
ncbi:sporulation-induced protein, variant 2 [Balamuthia mandrillaris]